MAFQAAKLQEGSTIPWKNQTGGTLTVGNVVIVGGRIGILIAGANPIDTTLANNSTGEVAIDGCWRLPKLSTDTWVEGQDLFWDTTNSRLTNSHIAVPSTNVAPGLVYAGRAIKIGANGDTKGDVKLNDGCDNCNIEFTVSFPDQATSDITITNPYNCPIQVIDAQIENTGANGANANTVQVCAAAAGASAISDAMSLNAKAAGDLVRAANINATNGAIAALTNFFLRQTKAGGTMGGKVRIRCARGK